MNAITNGVLLAVPDALQNIRNNGVHASIGTGRNNVASGQYLSVLNGQNNQITNANNAVAYAGILGGLNNLVTNNYGSIVGGLNNQVSGAYSSILGGSNNNDNGLAYVGIFGQNINNPLNMSANTFHVECLNAINTPGPFAIPPALPPGSIYWAPPGSPGKVLYIV